MATSVLPAVPVLDGLISFRAPRRSYVLINGREKEMSPMFVGNIITVPARGVVGPHAETDADGDIIPGTRVVEDIFDFDPELSQEIEIFNATRACIHILGMRPGSNGMAAESLSMYAQAGLSLLPRHPTKEMWQNLSRVGQERAQVLAVQLARDYMTWLEQKNTRRKSFGLDPEIGGAEFFTAKAIIEQANKELLRQYGISTDAPIVQAAAQSPTVSIPVPAPAPSYEADDIEDELEMNAVVAAKAMKLAESASTKHAVDKMALFNELLADPEFRLKAQRQWKINKRGNRQKSEVELQALADAGKKIEDEQ